MNNDQAEVSNEAPGYDTDTRRPLRFGWAIIVFGFFGFLGFAAFVPLHEGVPAPGIVKVAGERRPIQHLSGGIVQEVLVTEGQYVSKDQPLVRLDDAVARANFVGSKQQYFADLAVRARLLAEQSMAPQISFPPELAGETDPQIQKQIQNQVSLFITRRAALAAEADALSQTILANDEQLDTLRSELEGMRSLVEEGYAPRIRQNELQRQISARVRNSAETRQRINQRRQQYRAESEAQLAQVEAQLLGNKERYLALEDAFSRMTLKAPVSGQIMGLAVRASGAVIAPGQKIMDIVPAGEPLVIEGQIPPHMIDRVRAGDKVDVMFSFAKAPSVTAEGVIQSLSGDLVETLPQQGIRPHYLSRIVLTQEGKEQIKGLPLKPGMSAQVMIKTGSRTLLNYLLRPLTRRLNSAMREE